MKPQINHTLQLKDNQCFSQIFQPFLSVNSLHRKYKDAGMRSGEVFCGQLKLYTADKKNWVLFQIDTNGDIELTNQAGETATINLS